MTVLNHPVMVGAPPDRDLMRMIKDVDMIMFYLGRHGDSGL